MRGIVVTAAAASVLLAACSSPSSSHTSPPASSPASAAAPAPSTPAVAKVGDVAQLQDGVRVQVTSAVPGKASIDADGANPGDPVLTVTVRLTNNTPTTYNPGLVTAVCTYGPDGEQAGPVADVHTHTGAGFTSPIPPGGVQSARFGCAMPADAGNVLITVQDVTGQYAAQFATS